MQNKSAPLLIAAVIALTALGIVMLCSTGAYSGIEHSDNYHDVKLQARWMGIGLGICILFALFPYRYLATLAPWLYGVGVVLLALCFLPQVGQTINGASRWISLENYGLASLRMQPSEFARIAVIIAVATWFAHFAQEERNERTFVWGMLIPLAIVALPMGLIFIETDIGASALLGTVCLGIMFIAGTRWIYLGGLALLGMGGLAAAIFFISNRLERFLAFRDLEANKQEFGMQQWQGLLAFANGGLYGQGLGNGEQKLQNLYASTTDFIFPMVGEELGLFGSLGVVIAFVVIAVCGMAISFNASDKFGQLLAFGIVALIVSQAVINIGVTTAVLPNKGTPLPFVSYGGSNLLAYMIALGILINIYLNSVRVRSGEVALAHAKLPPRL